MTERRQRGLAAAIAAAAACRRLVRHGGHGDLRRLFFPGIK